MSSTKNPAKYHKSTLEKKQTNHIICGAYKSTPDCVILKKMKNNN